MSSIGPISQSQISSFADQTAGTISSIGAPTHAASDKEITEEVAAMLPKTWIDLLLSMNIWQNIDINIGLGSIGSIQRGQAISNYENAIIIAALTTWVENQRAQAAIANEEFGKRFLETTDDPLLVALKEFSETDLTTKIGNDDVNILQTIRNSPMLLAPLRSIDPVEVATAYQKAEQQIVMHILKQWVEQEAQLAELERETDRQQQIVKDEARGVERTFAMLHDYVKDIENKEQLLSQPMLSILITGIAGGTSMQVPLTIDTTTGLISFDVSKDSMMPLGQTVIIDMMKNEAQSLPITLHGSLNSVTIDLTQLMTNVQIAAAYWAIPGALTLLTAKGEEVPEKGPSEAAIRSYALTIAQFVESKDFTVFIKNMILKHIPLEKLTEERLRTFTATIKIMLLVNALAALDKQSTGGVIIRGEDIQGLLNINGTDENAIKLDEGDFRAVLVKLLREQFQQFQPKEQAHFLSLLVNYFNTNPKLETMIDPTKAFLAFSNPHFFRKIALSQRG